MSELNPKVPAGPTGPDTTPPKRRGFPANTNRPPTYKKRPINGPTIGTILNQLAKKLSGAAIGAVIPDKLGHDDVWPEDHPNHPNNWEPEGPPIPEDYPHVPATLPSYHGDYSIKKDGTSVIVYPGRPDTRTRYGVNLDEEIFTPDGLPGSPIQLPKPTPAEIKHDRYPNVYPYPYSPDPLYEGDPDWELENAPGTELNPEYIPEPPHRRIADRKLRPKLRLSGRLRVDFGGDGTIRIRAPKPQLNPKPRPERRGRDVKGGYIASLRVVNKTLGTITELADFVDAIAWNTYGIDPKTGQVAYGMHITDGDLAELAANVAKGEFKVDMIGALHDLAVQELMDIGIGKFNKTVAKELKKAGFDSITGVTYGSARRAGYEKAASEFSKNYREALGQKETKNGISLSASEFQSQTFLSPVKLQSAPHASWLFD